MISPPARPSNFPKESSPLLVVDDLHVMLDSARGSLSILNGVSLTLARGETLGLVGESGSGKSMTTNAVLGMLPTRGRVARGSVEFAGISISNASPAVLRSLRGPRIGTILQDPTASLNPTFTVGDQVGEPLRVHLGQDRRRAKAGAAELLERVGIQDAVRRVNEYPHQFSGGMRQRIVGAGAISCSPELIIADEPTTALDVTVQAAYLDLLESLQRDLGAALLLVSHDLAVVSRICHRTAVMYAGSIVETAPTSVLFETARHPYTLGLLSCLPSATAVGERLTPIPGNPPDPASVGAGCPFAARCPAVLPRCREERPPLTAVEDGHLVACHRADEALSSDLLWPRKAAIVVQDRSADDTPARPPTLELREVSKEFVTKRTLWGVPKTTFQAVADVSLAVRPGDSITIVGESGSGKTTSARMALGLDSPSSGQVLFNGEDLATLDRDGYKRYRRAVQAVFQDPFTSFNPRMPISAVVAEPLLELSKTMTRARVAERVDEVLHLVGLEPVRVRDSYPHQLSGGQRQRVAIARALSTRPDCLVLDEPVSALDVSIRVQVLNLLRDLREQTGVGILAISHDLGSVKYMSDTVHVMRRGRIVESGTTDQIFHLPQHEYTQQLLADAMMSKRSPT